MDRPLGRHLGHPVGRGRQPLAAAAAPALDILNNTLDITSMAVAQLTAAGFFVSPAANTNGITVMGLTYYTTTGDDSPIYIGTNATLTSNTKCSSLGGPVGNHPQRVNGSGIAQIFLPAGYGIGINFTGGSPVGHLAYVPGPNTLGHIDFSTLTVSRGTSLTAGSGGALIAAIIADSFTVSLKIRNAADTEIYDLNDAMTGTIADIRLATGVPVPFILPAGWDILASGGGEHAIWYRQL